MAKKREPGVGVNYCNGGYARLRIKAGPQRDQYVDRIILKAKLGRDILPGHTVEHADGNSLNIDPDNLSEVPQPVNTSLMHARRRDARAAFNAGLDNA